MKEKRNPEEVHAPLGAYIHQIECSGELSWLTLSGQVGMTKDGMLSEKAEEQFQEALMNIQRNLTAASMSVQDLTKLVIYLVDPMDLAERTAMLNEFLKGTEVCMTLLYVKGLASPQIKVEIDAWACKEGNSN